MCPSKNEIKNLADNLFEFGRAHSEIWIYGAGAWAKRFFNVFRNFDIEVKGFIVTEGQETKEGMLFNRPIISSSNAILPSDSGVIVSFKGATESIIRNALGHGADFFLLPDGCFTDLLYCLSLMRITRFVKEIYTRKPLFPISDGDNILVIRLDAIGDIVMSTPFIRELRRNYPHSHITLIINKINETLFRNCPYVSEVISYDVDSYGSENIDDFPEIQERVKLFVSSHIKGTRHYQFVFHLCEIMGGRRSIETLFLEFLINADVYIGKINSFSTYSSLHYSVFSDVFSFISYELEEKHESEYMLDLLRYAGGNIVNDKLELWPEDNARSSVHDILRQSENKHKWVIAFGLVGSLPCKNWPPYKFAKIISYMRKLYGKDLFFILMGGSDAIEAANNVMGTLESTVLPCVLNMTGQTTLSETVAFLEKCSLYIGADTGLMHIAAAMGVSIVELAISLPGCTFLDSALPARMGPWRVDYIALEASHGLDDCKGLCRKPYPHCITQITTSSVIEAAEKLLDKTRDKDNCVYELC